MIDELPPPVVPVESLPARARCPCCDRELPLGLFAHAAKVPLPIPVRIMRQAGHPLETIFQEQVIIAADRHFILADATLPLSQENSPVRAQVWVEIEGRQLSRISETFESGVRPINVNGVLACDMPGFPGTINSKVTVHVDPVGQLTQIISCSDQRLSGTSLRLTHDELASLYRRLWGAPGDVSRPRDDLRAAVRHYWESFTGREVLYAPVEPPPPLAGAQPGLIGVVPPMDTGDIATVMTVGNCDVTHDGSPRVEFICWAQDPSERFIQSFAEFVYSSRLADYPCLPGDLISEINGIPGTRDDDDDSAKVAWLVCEPFWDDTLTLPELSAHGEIITPVAVVPLTGEEALFCQHQGPDALVAALLDTEAALFELNRPSCVTVL